MVIFFEGKWDQLNKINPDKKLCNPQPLISLNTIQRTPCLIIDAMGLIYVKYFFYFSDFNTFMNHEGKQKHFHIRHR